MESFKPDINKSTIPEILDWTQIQWECPSNIALIKYWGKKGQQLPLNPSLSFCLQDAKTIFTFKYRSKSEGIQDFFFSLEGRSIKKFEDRLYAFIRSITDYFPFLTDYCLHIEAHNTFPHSAGIASSASAMGALALCLCSMEQNLLGSLSNHSDFFRKASFIARLGSGSASRSIYGGMVIWGEVESFEQTSNLFAVNQAFEVHENFNNLYDAVLIIDSSEKLISSSEGHALMNGHPYAENRIEQAHENLIRLLRALSEGDMQSFIEIIEQEALSLHALMMSSASGYTLLKPNTLIIIDLIRQERLKNGLKMGFTLDAGPNIHLIYPGSQRKEVLNFLHTKVVQYLEKGYWIDDKSGNGPKQIL